MLVSVATMDEYVLEIRDITNPQHSTMNRAKSRGIFFMKATNPPKSNVILSSRYSGFPSHFFISMFVF